MPNKLIINLKKYFIVYLAIILVGVSFAGGFLVGQKAEFANQAGKLVNIPGIGEKPLYLTEDVNFDLFQEVWQVVKDKYIDRDKTVDSEMFYGALRGLVASLGDPYSDFFDPKMTAEFSDELRGSFEGIGAEINIKNGQLLIVSPLPGSPAYQAGLQASDEIWQIDGKDTKGMTLDQAVSSIRGPAGTKVKLLIKRTDWPEAKEIELTRREVHFDSVRFVLRKDNIAYIEVISFNNDTMKLFNQAINEILVKKPKGIILDLRNNPGGYLDTAIAMASEWVAAGPVVIESSAGQEKPLTSNGQARLANFPTMILVNNGSASASEIVAGALQDYQKATLIGEKTFGKGSVQELEPLTDGSSVKVTVAKWLTPKGRSIDKEGIIPDVSIERTKEDYNLDRDPQLDKAIEILLKKK